MIKSKRTYFIYAILSLLVASILPYWFFEDILLFKIDNLWIYEIITLLLIGIVFYIISKSIRETTLTLILIALVGFNELFRNSYYNLEFMRTIINKLPYSLQNMGYQIADKGVISLFMIILLIIIYKKRSDFYFQVGNVFEKANEIKLFGIPNKKWRWLPLAIISGILISSGTAVLMLRQFGFDVYSKIELVFYALPSIILLAIFNSFFEGIMFRCSILTPLSKSLNKNLSILLAALYFGSMHMYGAPGGVFGCLMAGILGFYLLRSMYETKGLMCPWIIHAFQDFVIVIAVFLYN